MNDVCMWPRLGLAINQYYLRQVYYFIKYCFREVLVYMNFVLVTIILACYFS